MVDALLRPQRVPVGMLTFCEPIADGTSCAAASMLRSSENWMVIELDPKPLDEVMLSIPAMVENCFSSGVATAAAIVSGLAPGRFALTWIVGKSTVGRSLTARRVYETAPKNRIPIMTSAVMTGLRINNAVIEVLP